MQLLERLCGVHMTVEAVVQCYPMLPRLYKVSTNVNLVYCYTCIYLLCVLLNICTLKKTKNNFSSNIKPLCLLNYPRTNHMRSSTNKAPCEIAQ